MRLSAMQFVRGCLWRTKISAAAHRAGTEGEPMVGSKRFTLEEAKKIGEGIGVNWGKSKFDVEQFWMGLQVELEHGRRDPATDVTHDDPITTGKIALAHLNEYPDYYTRLAKMEAEAEAGNPA